MYYTLHDITNASPFITDDVVFPHVLLPMTTYCYTFILHLIALVTV